MRLRLLSVALLLLGFWCLGHQETARSQWLLGVGKTVSASCAGFSIDGAATSQPATGGSTTTQNITTLSANEIIFSIITSNTALVTSTSDTAGLSWTSPRATAGTGGNDIFESWALSAGTLTGDTITTHYGGATSFVETIVFGVVGAKTAAPFDTGGSSNVPVTGTASPISVTTNNANTLALGFFRAASVSPQATWTQIAATSSFTLAQFKAFTSPQVALSISNGGSGTNGAIGDALVCGP